MSTRTRPGRRAGLSRGLAVACVLGLTLSACGSEEEDTAAVDLSPADVEAALEEGGELTVWAWEPTLEQVAADFEEAHPNVTVELVNVGTGDEQYTALQNAMSAGDGLPDVAHIEYFALGQFTIAGHLLDMAPSLTEELEDSYTPGPWEAVQGEEGELFALPMDSGPMALFYNQDIFDEHNIEVPETWDEYVEAARTLQTADPETYILADNGDAGATTSRIWQAGGRPYTVSGDTVIVDFADEGSEKYAETWQQLIDEDLLLDVTDWSDEWYQALGDGSAATLISGAWMGLNLVSDVPAGEGSWRVAPLPQWEEGEEVSAENGGSALAVPAESENPALGQAFIEYANAGDGVQTRIDEGAFPATVADLESEEFLETEYEYFGGQQINEVFAESASNVGEDWSYLPYQAHANSLFSDTVGQAYVSSVPLTEALSHWQEASINYGESQGFSVSPSE